MTCLIDDKSVLRGMAYYPMSNGRLIPEFVRLLTAMQTSDKYGIALPEGWQQSKKAISPPFSAAHSARQGENDDARGSLAP